MSPHPSPWRASAAILVPITALGIGFGIFVGLRSPIHGLAVAGATLGLVGGAQLQAAFRLNWALREFARQVPGDPEASESYTGAQSLRWHDPPIAASGNTHRFTVRGFTVEIDGASRSGSTFRPREAAREALSDLGREPAFDRPEDRLPSVYPRLSAIRTGVPAAIAGFVAAALLAGDPLLSTTAGLGTGALAAVVRWTGLVRVRRALTRFVHGLDDGGVAVDRIDLIRGIVSQTYEVHTDDGTVILRCVLHPKGRLSARVGDRERSGRFADARTVGREFATELPRDVPAERADPERVRVSSTHRLSSAAFGAAFAAFGLALIARPGFFVGGDCTEGCLLVAIVEYVPFGNVLFGGTLVLVGMASMGVALSGTMPADAYRWCSRNYR